MPELRKDPVLGRWIIIAKERAKRPTDFLIEEPQVLGGFCPLCPGNEEFTPPEIVAYRHGGFSNTNQSDWQVRVVPNKYPALIIEGELGKAAEGLFDRMNGIGAHEVVIESPGHNDRLWLQSPENIALVFRVFRDRLLDLQRDSRFRYVMIFKNYGKAAGASLEHSHSQLIALPVLPRMITNELDGSLSYYRYKDRCLFCDIIRQEIEQNVRVVCQNESFITISPFAPRTPFEMWVLPKRHRSGYCHEDDGQLLNLARLMAETLKRLDRCIPNVPYNFVLHTQPLRSGELEHFHWHFEIVPKLTSIAGFEWGSGFYINPMPPEEATEYLRESLDS